MKIHLWQTKALIFLFLFMLSVHISESHNLGNFLAYNFLVENHFGLKFHNFIYCWDVLTFSIPVRSTLFSTYGYRMWAERYMEHSFLRQVLLQNITQIIIRKLKWNGCKNSYSVELHIVFGTFNASPVHYISVASRVLKPFLHSFLLVSITSRIRWGQTLLYSSSSLSLLPPELEEGMQNCHTQHQRIYPLLNLLPCYCQMHIKVVWP